MILTEQQRDFLDEVHYAIVGTLNANGAIQQTVVWYLREGDELRFSIGANSVKARNLRRTPHATVTVAAGRRYLTVSGSASLEPVDPDLRYRMAVRYIGVERAAAWVAQRPEAARASVRLTIAQVYGQGVA